MAYTKLAKNHNTRNDNSLDNVFRCKSRTANFIGGSSSGRTADSDSADGGSNPSPPANYPHNFAPYSRFMRGGRHSSRVKLALILPIQLLVGTIALLFSMASTAVDFDQFTGSYSGSVDIETGDKISRRDMSVNIAAAGDSFQVTWKSVIHKSDGRLKQKEYTIRFLPTQRDGIYSSAMTVNVFGNPIPLNPLKGEPYVWGRIVGNTLTVYSLFIDNSGGYEMQEYHRTLVEGGMDLEYQRIWNGEKLKTIRAFLQKDQ